MNALLRDELQGSLIIIPPTTLFVRYCTDCVQNLSVLGVHAVCLRTFRLMSNLS